MPYAVTHVLIAIIIADIIRDYFTKKKFSLYFILIAGISGLLPDIDIPIYWILNSLFGIPEIHRTFTHTIFLPLIFFGLAFLFKQRNSEKKFRCAQEQKFLTKERIFKLNIKLVFLMISLGLFMHLLLDAILVGYIIPFYPINFMQIGLNLVKYLPLIMQETFLPALDAVLLVLWLIHEEIKHKISDFI